MASDSTVMNQENVETDTTATVLVQDSDPKPMDSKASSSSSTPTPITIVTTTDDTKNTETENTTAAAAVTAAASSSSGTNNSNVDIAAPVEDNSAADCIKALTYAICLEKGRRSTMEDVVAVHPGFLEICCKDAGGCMASECKFAMEKLPVHYFGLFDGHGGHQVSNYCANELCGIVAEEWKKGSTLDGCGNRWEVTLCKAYERADNAFKDETLAPKFAGSTALVVIVSACQIIAANCGDSRAVLCRGRQAIPLTFDHRPDRVDEYERITSSGGRILNWGCLRVEGILAMSRAIGDLDLKQWVISVPEVTFTTRTEKDEFLILASDGLWDVLSNEEVVKFARREIRQHRRLVRARGSPFPAAWYVSQQVLRRAYDAGSYDNISVIVVDLKIPRAKAQQKL
ncbi:hypothetical protein PTKIN_Ptkin18bG0063200 [Pterospermum kingtungense]